MSRIFLNKVIVAAKALLVAMPLAMLLGLNIQIWCSKSIAEYEAWNNIGC